MRLFPLHCFFVVTVMMMIVSTTAATSRVEVVVQVQDELHLETVLVTAVASGAGQPVESKVAMAGRQGKTTLTLEQAGSWRLNASAPGFWSPEVDLTAADATGETVTLTLWPAVATTASFRHPEGSEPPDEARLTLSRVATISADSPLQPESAEARCSIIASRLSDCSLPAGQWHLRIKVARYIPHYQWSLHLESGKQADLGQIKLEPGASLFGKVVTSDGSVCPPDTRIELQPLMDRSMLGSEETRKIASLTAAETVNEWSYFHFEGIKPGTYQLIANHPDYVPSTLSPVVLEPLQDLELSEALVLQRARQLAVFVDPSEDSTGSPWTLELHSLSQTRESTQKVEGQTEHGEWVSPGLPEGSYLLLATDSLGNQVFRQVFSLTESYQTTWIELSYVQVNGRVVFEDEPLAAELQFEQEGEKVSTESDQDGLFKVVLHEPGAWLVSVEQEEEGISCRNIEVEIEPEQEELLIELPSTKVIGEVVYEEGGAARKAWVELIGTIKGKRTSFYKVNTDDDGTFELRGVTPDLYRVEAGEGARRSGIQTVQLDENVTQTLRLALRDYWVIEGRVVAGGEPVPAATLIDLSFTPQGTLAQASSRLKRTELDGSFKTAAPSHSRLVRLLVMAVGHTFSNTTVTREMVEDTDSIEINLLAGGGTVLLPKVSSTALVVVNGEPAPISVLTQWSFMQGALQTDTPVEVYTVPGMPAGQYVYCDLSFEEACLVLAGMALPRSERCTEGYLSEGGTLELDGPK